MQKSTYLFYDIESTGLNKCFDQVLQFAAIRTDLQLNEIERYELRIKLNPDVIPAPEALATTRLSISQIQNGELEIEAIQKIHKLLNTPGTISVGYNTLKFDDELLRFSFYRNLLPPYTHQFANNCSRMDIYPIALLYYLFKPEIINWPFLDGKISLKLENLITANDLVKGQAHDAMVDVIATLELARKFYQEKTMWDYCCGYFQKNTELSRIAKLSGEAFMVSGNIGTANNYIAPVVSIGPHFHYKNQTLWLRLDQEALMNTTVNTIAENTFVFHKKLAETPILLPLENRFYQHINSERTKITEKNKQFLQDNPKLWQAIRDYHQNYLYPKVPNLDIDAALYEIGFATREDEALFQQFHLADKTIKAEIATKINNTKRQEQAWRILGRFYPEHLPETLWPVFAEYCQNENVIDFRGNKKLTKAEAIQRSHAMLSEAKLDPQQIKIIEEFSSFFANSAV